MTRQRPQGRRTRRPDARRDLVSEAAVAFERGRPEIRPDGLPREMEVPDERDGFEVLVVFRLTDDDRAVVDRVMVGDNRPAKGLAPATGVAAMSRVLERLPLARWQREALDEWPRHALAGTEVVGGVEWRGPDPEAVARAKERLGDPVEQAAAVYESFADSHAPTRAVAEQLGIPYETARSRVKAARTRGRLPPAPGQGRRSRPHDNEED